MDLVTFAAKHKPTCFVCSIPQRTEIEKAWANGIRGAAIRDWLIEDQGYNPADIPERKKIQNHFDYNHKGAR